MAPAPDAGVPLAADEARPGPLGQLREYAGALWDARQSARLAGAARTEPAPDVTGALRATVGGVLKEILSGDEGSAARAAEAWALAQRAHEQEAAERERRDRAAQWLAARVRRGGGSWFPGE